MNQEIPYIQESAYGMSLTISQYSASHIHPSHIIKVKSYMLEILETRPVANFLPPPLEKCVGHNLKLLEYCSSKNLGPSQKTLRLAWCPKLVTGLLETIWELRFSRWTSKKQTEDVNTTFSKFALLFETTSNKHARLKLMSRKQFWLAV